MVAIGCQAVVGVARKASTVWRQVATGDRLIRLVLKRSHPLPSGGWRGELGFHRLATGGYGLNCFALNGSHPLPSGGGAWRGRLPPSGDRWLRAELFRAEW
jgi:hypothetical protein